MRGRGLPGGRGGGAGALRWLRGRSERRATRQSAYVSPAGRRRRGLLTLRYPRGVREREVAPAGLIRPSLRCDVWADRRFVASFRRRVSGRSERQRSCVSFLALFPVPRCDAWCARAAKPRKPLWTASSSAGLVLIGDRSRHWVQNGGVPRALCCYLVDAWCCCCCPAGWNRHLY